MEYVRKVGEWDTIHYLYLNKEESQKVFLDANEAEKCWQRNGGEWIRSPRHSYRILKPEIDAWMREVAGHAQGETWECDRYYYPDEILPELPKGGGRGAWLKKFICYPYYSGGWAAGDYFATNASRAAICFYEGRTLDNDAATLPMLFAMKFL